MNYRPEIDGLRAIAVLPVIFFHAGFAHFSGGYVGVDVFFVISGYLITTIIYQEVAQGRFSFWSFYERRARRILPALFVVALACIPFAWLWMMPNEFKHFSQSLLGVATFTSNILFWKESGYFAGPAELKPLLHTWSLAVEEQFYIFYPPLLLALYYFVPKRLFVIITLGSLASLGLAHYASSAHPSANFYLLASRAWELGVGALLALYLNRNTGAPSKKIQGPQSDDLPYLREFGGLIGLVLILYAVITFDDGTPFPSLWTLFPVLGTALVILSANLNTLVGRLLSLRLMVGLGLISYSAYLWHQPLFAFARIRLSDEVPIWLYWVLIVATLLLAWFTWLTIELPARKRLKLPRAQILSGAAAGCVAVGLVGAFGWANQGVTTQNVVAKEMIQWKDSKSPYRSTCHNPDSPEEACVIGEGNNTPLYVWSDSHGVELGWQLSEATKEFNIPVKLMTGSGCQPTIGVGRRPKRSSCLEHKDSTYSYLIRKAPRGVVVLIARWPLNIEGDRFDNREGGVEFGDDATVFPLDWEDGSEKERIAKVGQAVESTVYGLIQAGHQVVLVYPVPEVGWDVPTYLARRTLFESESSGPLSTSFQVYLERSANARAYLNAIPDHDKLLRVRPANLFCDTEIPDRCIARLPDGRPLYFDDDHPNEIGARLIAQEVLSQMEKEWGESSSIPSFFRRRKRPRTAPAAHEST